MVLTFAGQLQRSGHTARILTLHDGNDFLELSQKLDIRRIRTSISYSLLGKDIIDTQELDAQIDDFRPDVIHSNLIEAELVTMAAARSRAVHITHWHGCHALTDPVRPLDLLKKDAWWNWNNVRRLRSNYRNKGTHFLCISQFIKGYVERVFHPRTSDMTVIHNPVDLSEFEYHRHELQGFQLLNIGSMTSLKYQSFLLLVMRRLLDLGCNDVRLTLLGDGPDRGRLETEVSTLRLSEHVVFAGIVGDPSNWLNRSHVLVHSAPFEPFGLVVLEAKACGVPAIGFDQGGITEVIRHGTDGFLVKFNDIEAYAARVLELRNDHNLWQSMSEAGRAVVGQYSIETYMERLESLYSSLLAQNKR